MPRRSNSQWDFGELFSPEQTRHVLTVSELTTRVKGLLEQHLGTLWVTGEITNLRQQTSGHIYFTLKDAASQVACVLFRGERVTNRALIEDGQKVILQGDLTVYEARGQYQIIIRQVEVQGLGALQAAFERLKARLAAEGWFAPERKRPIPRYPPCIGIVSSPTGAALRDVLHVVQRRNPALRLILAPCRVQGAGAAAEIAAAIRLLNEFASTQAGAGAEPGPQTVAAILVTRGGGSLEDLWAFNEEEVARAIGASSLPVISAIGHEIDFTISDFVADLRAATPSAAAEILTEGVFVANAFIREAPDRLRASGLKAVEEARDKLERLAGRLGRAHPCRRLNETSQRLDDLCSDVNRCMREALRRTDLNRAQLINRLLRCRPQKIVQTARERLELQTSRLADRVALSLRRRMERVEAVRARLHLLGPEQVLARGYSITTDAATGQVLRNAGAVTQGQVLRTQLHHGRVISRVESPE
ncbi:MAG: exodeoxyribonuclease VII large subunit [Verrucomicrobia bacterium]|jgi:exodeoxyribonuclease VII large subunit|nr:exodeoxyribonuclease VII large subunit [Verrucomicrobiota bacterium]